jgi:hypothetical protein
LPWTFQSVTAVQAGECLQMRFYLRSSYIQPTMGKPPILRLVGV